MSFASLGIVVFLLRTLHHLPVCLDSTFYNLTEPIELWETLGLGVGAHFGVSINVSNLQPYTTS
jgi:hypothetical protein